MVNNLNLEAARENGKKAEKIGTDKQNSVKVVLSAASLMMTVGRVWQSLQDLNLSR